ncbi:MAG: hypothetical protein ABIC40_01525 [bacterium]
MLVRFTPDVTLDLIGHLTKRCETLGVQYRILRELKATYLIIESADPAKINELYHQFRHHPSVAEVILPQETDDPLTTIPIVKIKAGNRQIGKDSRPVIIAGSPYLESGKQAVELASRLAELGVNVFKAGPYRPSESLPAKMLYSRTESIAKEILQKCKIPAITMIEMLGPKAALTIEDVFAFHVPGKFMFETGLKEQLAGMKVPVFIERHPDAHSELWLDSARAIVRLGNSQVALVETGRRVDNVREIDLVGLVGLIDRISIPVLVYPSLASNSPAQLGKIAAASLAAGASGVIFDVHLDPMNGLLSDGYCLSIEEFEKILKSLGNFLN